VRVVQRAVASGDPCFFYNGIRAGAEEEVHGVTDLRTGAPLAWEVVDGGARERTDTRGPGRRVGTLR
jgi:hypothetical protein